MHAFLLPMKKILGALGIVGSGQWETSWFVAVPLVEPVKQNLRLPWKSHAMTIGDSGSLLCPW